MPHEQFVFFFSHYERRTAVERLANAREIFFRRIVVNERIRGAGVACVGAVDGHLTVQIERIARAFPSPEFAVAMITKPYTPSTRPQ